jgi:hypothetical protein
MCKASHTISDRKLADVVIGQLRALLAHPEAVELSLIRFGGQVDYAATGAWKADSYFSGLR